MDVKHLVCTEPQGIRLRELGIMAWSTFRSYLATQELPEPKLFFARGTTDEIESVPRYMLGELLMLLPQFIHHGHIIRDRDFHLCVTQHGGAPERGKWSVDYVSHSGHTCMFLPPLFFDSPSEAAARALINLMETGHVEAKQANTALSKGVPYHLWEW